MSEQPPVWRNSDPDAEREARKYERPVPSRALILAHLTEQEGPCELPAMLDHFGLSDEIDRVAFSRRLEAMLRDGQLVRNRRGAYGPAQQMALIAGTVIGHRDGFGFLKPDAGGDDVFLPPRQMRSLMHGDRALVRISGTDQRGRQEGSLVDVLERSHERLVGRYVEERGVAFVIPDNSRITQDVMVPPGEHNDAKPGQIVTVEITQQPGKRNPPMGRIVEVLGEHMAPGMEIDVAIRAHGLPFEWPPAVEQEAAAIGDTVPADVARLRKNLRDLPLVTIDGEDARDFDDAVYCRAEGDGWRLWVAIADVSAYVETGSALDVEAHLRGNSVYFPAQVLPMLPEALSNGLCSLNPEVDRLCMVCEMQVSAKGEVKGADFYPAVMRSHARLTYDLVAEALEQPKVAHKAGIGHLLPALQDLQSLFRAFSKARRGRGAIDFDTVETRIEFGTGRKIDRIVPVHRNDAHRMIEECMIAANVQSALFLARHKMPTLYRVHERPSSDKLEVLRGFLAERGLSLGGGETPEAHHFAKLLASTGERVDARLIQTVMLRSLMQAVYTPANDGHFGLALDCYAHFTSPIRRYPDLLVHRAIKHVLDGGTASDFEYTAADMQQLGVHSSMTERRADDATRDAVNWLKCEYMMDRVGETFTGLITTVTPFGLFVELDDIYVEGLIHVSSLRNDYYQHDPKSHCLRGDRSGVEYHVADPISVRLVRVNLDDRKIDFEPADQAGQNTRGRATKPGKQKGKQSSKGNKSGKPKSKQGKGTGTTSKAGKSKQGKSKRRSR